MEKSFSRRLVMLCNHFSLDIRRDFFQTTERCFLFGHTPSASKLTRTIKKLSICIKIMLMNVAFHQQGKIKLTLSLPKENNLDANWVPPPNIITCPEGDVQLWVSTSRCFRLRNFLADFPIEVRSSLALRSKHLSSNIYLHCLFLLFTTQYDNPRLREQPKSFSEQALQYWFRFSNKNSISPSFTSQIVCSHSNCFCYSCCCACLELAMLMSCLLIDRSVMSEIVPSIRSQRSWKWIKFVDLISGMNLF